MPIGTDGSISSVRNKEVRAKLYREEQRQKKKAKLAKRIARKEAEQRGEVVERGFTRTIENTREWLGDSEEYADPRTRPAQVDVDAATGDVRVDLGTLADLFPLSAPHPQLADGRLAPDAKVLITTSPGKPPAPFTREFCDDLQALLGGKTRADIVPRRSPKFELGKVARWARGRGYGAIAVVGEDHAKPTSLTLSLLPSGPTAHFRLSGLTLSKDIKGHAKSTSHPPELVLNHFSTPLGLSLASLLSHLFLPPSAADILARQGYAGRQVVLAQNSRDFVFIRRYRYMFALKSHQLGPTTKKRVGLERKLADDPEWTDDTIKTRFQEIGPRMTVKMRWIRRGALGETGDERDRREKEEAAARGERNAGGDAAPELEEFGTVGEGEDPEKGEVGRGDGDGQSKAKASGKGKAKATDMDIDGDGDGDGDGAEDQEEERRAALDIGLDPEDDQSQPNFNFDAAATAAAEAEQVSTTSDALPPPPPSKKRPRATPRKRSKPAHPLLRPARSPTPPPGVSAMGEPEAVPLPPRDGKKKKSQDEGSLLSTVGKSWHAGRGEGGVREGEKRREWNWKAKMQVSRRKFFL